MTANKKYLKQLNAHLTCSPAHRKKFIADIIPLLDEFSDNYPQAKLTDYIQVFGNPKTLADDLLQTLDHAEVDEFKKKKARKKLSIKICIAAVILLIFSGLLWYIHFILINHVDLDVDSELIVINETTDVDETE